MLALRATIPLTIGCGLLSTARAVHAEQPGASVAAQPDSLPVELRPRQDLVGRHLFVGASASLLAPYGELQEGMRQRSLVSDGLGVSLDIAFGLSRFVTLGLWGTLGLLPPADGSCTNCDATSYAAGPFVRYHVVQGTRLDPWLALGLGFQTLTVNTDVKQQFSGPRWLRLALGADWYALSALSLGPSFELNLTSHTERPNPEVGAGVATELLFGLRLGLNAPGK